jgi:acyl carrier protein
METIQATKKITAPETFEMLSAAFDEPVENISPSVLRESIVGWDSMGALALMAELDERFNLELTADESRKFVRVSDVIAFLRRHGVLSE